jgi:hypothetical protein
METVVQRICWNSRGWQLPSGSAYEGGFPAQRGFGHEEWNFQLEDASDGYVYGYTYSTPAEAKLKDAGGKFRIVFFAIHPESSDRVVAGVYHLAEIAPPVAYAPLFDDFEKRGVFERRASELCDATDRFTRKAALTEVKNSLKKQWLKVRCPVSKVESFSHYPSLNSIVGDQSVSHRFSRFTYLKSEFSTSFLRRSQGATLSESPTAASPLTEDAYYRESSAKLKIIVPRHNKLSNDFCKWLKKEHGVAATQEQERVDVRFSLNERTVLAELKICYGVGTTKSIREALGQLLEYNHYPYRVAASTWLIVLDEEPTETDRKFVELLRAHWSLPVTIGWIRGRGFLFDEKWAKK